MLTILAASLTVARFVLGGLLKRISRGVVLTSSLAIAVFGIVLLGVAPGLSGASVAVAFIGIGFAAVFPVVLGSIGGLFPHLSGTAFGIALVIALAGNTVMNTAFGAASAKWGFDLFPWYLLLTLAGMALFLFLGLRSMAHRSPASKG
jgi:MFS family permease